MRAARGAEVRGMKRIVKRCAKAAVYAGAIVVGVAVALYGAAWLVSAVGV